MKLKALRRSTRREKKYDAIFEYPDGKTRKVAFGQKGYSDFTRHKNETRKQRYLDRHRGMGENWRKPDTPGALSRWILWNKKTLKASVSDFKRRFGV